MKSSAFLLLSAIVGSGLVLADAPPAPVIMDNIPGTCAMADIVPNEATGATLRVEVAVTAALSGRGVNVTINMNGGPGPESGPYMYHIHEYPVPSDGNCTATGGHLDPTHRGETPPCDSNDPASCQVGDLSGENGTCSTLSGCTKFFQDPYLSLTPGNPAFIGDKSFVVHFPNKTRIGCANFRLQCAGQNTTAGSYPTSTTGGKGLYNSSQPTGGNSTSGSFPTTPKGTGSPTSVPNAAAKVGFVLNAAVWAMLLPVGVAAL